MIAEPWLVEFLGGQEYRHDGKGTVHDGSLHPDFRREETTNSDVSVVVKVTYTSTYEREVPTSVRGKPSQEEARPVGKLPNSVFSEVQKIVVILIAGSSKVDVRDVKV